MEHLSLEIFDREGTGSKYATLPEDTTISITDTSEIFASGDVWSHSFTLNVRANAHIFGTSGEIHGSRLHEQINKHRARLWVEGLPLYLGYLKLDDEVEVDEDGNVDVSFESGQKTFDEMIEGTSAREVSVGDVVIGVALNRKRVSVCDVKSVEIRLDGLEPFTTQYPKLEDALARNFRIGSITGKTPYAQQWPKLVKSNGEFIDSAGKAFTHNYTNVQTPYDASHPFCNINICYQFKSLGDDGEEKVGRGYTKRLAYSNNDTTDGGDNQTRFNNAPNFYLLYFIDRLFKDLGIHVDENQCLDVKDLRRVFMLNYGCYYEEIEAANIGTENYLDTPEHLTPNILKERYGQYYIQIIRPDDLYSLVKGWDGAGQYTYGEAKGLDNIGKVLLRDFTVFDSSGTIFTGSSIEGTVVGIKRPDKYKDDKYMMRIDKTSIEAPKLTSSNNIGYYSSYLAYATGDNYPNVEINEIIEALKSMFGVRLLFDADYKRVRIVLLRNIFRNTETQQIACDIISETKTENCIRGFRMTYGKGTEDTSFYYKGFADLFPRQTTTWKYNADKHDYSQWVISADYGRIKQAVSASNKRCYITPVNGNAYGVKVDEDEDVLFPSLFEYAGYMDAEDGDCTGEDETIEEVTCGASPLIMNEVEGAYFSLFSGDMAAPAVTIDEQNKDASWKKVKWRSTYARVLQNSNQSLMNANLMWVSGTFDVYLSEGFRIRLLDNYSVGNDGTPFDEADPGLCFGIMRGSGADAGLKYWSDPDDGEYNDTWDIIPGGGAIDHSDTCDGYGNQWDYNGTDTGIGDTEGRISLKLRAEKPNPYFDPTMAESDANRRYLEITNPNLRGRGLTDQFYKEYSYWVRNARIVKMEVRMTLAQLLTIDKTKRVTVGDVTGFIKKMQYSVSNQTGLGNVTMEVMYI